MSQWIQIWRGMSEIAQGVVIGCVAIFVLELFWYARGSYHIGALLREWKKKAHEDKELNRTPEIEWLELRLGNVRYYRYLVRMAPIAPMLGMACSLGIFLLKILPDAPALDRITYISNHGFYSLWALFGGVFLAIASQVMAARLESKWLTARGKAMAEMDKYDTRGVLQRELGNVGESLGALRNRLESVLEQIAQTSSTGIAAFESAAGRMVDAMDSEKLAATVEASEQLVQRHVALADDSAANLRSLTESAERRIDELSERFDAASAAIQHAANVLSPSKLGFGEIASEARDTNAKLERLIRVQEKTNRRLAEVAEELRKLPHKQSTGSFWTLRPWRSAAPTAAEHSLTHSIPSEADFEDDEDGVVAMAGGGHALRVTENVRIIRESERQPSFSAFGWLRRLFTRRSS